jgi:Ca2+/Na+ antiporter
MYFLLSQRQYLILSLLGALAIVLAIVMFYYSYRMGVRHIDPDEPVEPGHEFNDGLAEGTQPIPVFTVLLFIAFVIWGVGYVIAVSKGWLHVQ